ncbi:hypothetical protein RJ640_016804 [Escallonia rubra]|uniref:Glycine-rich protein n=1 Tax=Escallonia rubra TaxID=112253 RepID=A0AA88SJE5_9ASTE|nr:hypothetical protein RJ640_016804 [Escallonia rubra]
MSYTQVAAWQPPSLLCTAPGNVSQLYHHSVKLTSGSSAYLCTRCRKASFRLTTAALRYRQCTPVCLFGGKGKSESNNEASPWKSLEKAMGGLKKEQSLEDVLRQQIEKQEFSGGGSGGNRPGGGGGDGSGGSDDEGFSGVVDETVQVILATVGFIFLYMFIVEGEEISVFVKDYLKYIFGGQKSLRLRRTMYQWRKFFQRLSEKKEVQPDWLERAIVNTPTWWDSPEKYTRILNSYLKPKSYDEF